MLSCNNRRLGAGLESFVENEASLLSTLSNLSNHFYQCYKSRAVRAGEWGGSPEETFQGSGSGGGEDNSKVSECFC